MSAITSQLENDSIYVTLSLRGAQAGFHWGIFIPTDKPTGGVWHAVNRSGGWSLEVKTTNRLPDSISLCILFKVGAVDSRNWERTQSTLTAVPSSGQPSRNTQEAFTCRVWVKDALLALHQAGVITLVEDIATIEATAIEWAEQQRSKVETSRGAAKVFNSTGFTTTS